jgi:hypothetical protein
MDKKKQAARRFEVNRLWIVTAPTEEEARRICKANGIEPESVYPYVEDVDCLVDAIEYVSEDPERT